MYSEDYYEEDYYLKDMYRMNFIIYDNNCGLSVIDSLYYSKRNKHFIDYE